MFRSNKFIIRNTPLRLINIKNKLTFRVILTLMVLNILISIAILRQQTRINFYFDNFYNKALNQDSKIKNFELLTTLNAFRLMFGDSERSNQLNDNYINLNYLKEYLKFSIKDFETNNNQLYDLHLQPALTPPLSISKLDNDYLFNKFSFFDIFESSNRSKLKSKKFYEANILLNNENLCKPRQKPTRAAPNEAQENDTNRIIVLCLIHSHKNNYIRRQTMRDTWLSQTNLHLFELFDLHEFSIMNNKSKSANLRDFLNKKIELVHLFFIGNDVNQNNTDDSLLNLESSIYNDIIMIDTLDNYQNLIYKHLTLISWAVKYCSNAAFIVKLDDDVYINIKSLSKHLLTKFGQNPVDSKFMYCHVIHDALPIRKNVSKWFVSNETYPFEYYPQYCEGFSYITNVPTIKLMLEQSRQIPRFWIDDVYVTGFLLYGFKEIKWYNYQNVLKWSYYDFWDLSNTLGIYEVYFNFLKLFDINASDYYKLNYFVILHLKNDDKEINYDQFNDNTFFLSLVNETSKSLIRINNYFKYNTLNNKNISCATYKIKQIRALLPNGNNENIISNCYNYKINFYNIHFYNFCRNLFSKDVFLE